MANNNRDIKKVALVHIRDRKLMVVRSKNKDLYYMPGGKPETGETDAEALIRELKEEIDVDVVERSIKFLKTYRAQAHSKPEGVMLNMFLFEAEIIGIPRASNEIDDIRFIDSNDIDLIPLEWRMIIDDLKMEGLVD